jgi:hypothetical protein
MAQYAVRFVVAGRTSETAWELVVRAEPCTVIWRGAAAYNPRFVLFVVCGYQFSK